MANHCWNFAVFTDENKDGKGLLEFYSRLERIREDFQKKVRDLPDDYIWVYGLNGYILTGEESPQANEQGVYTNDPYSDFGSKWFDCRFTVDQENGAIESIELSGDSAWSPMLPLFEKICTSMKLKCYGHYEESGMDFAGEFEIDSNGITSHDEMTYNEYNATNNPDGYWENIMSYIEDSCYSSVEEIFEEFKSVNWELSDLEKEQLETRFKESRER